MIHNNITISQAIINLRPGENFVVVGEKYNGLVWYGTGTPPSEEEVQAELARMQAEWDSKEYQRQRAQEYPSIEEQLDMLYWDKVNGTNNWQTAIAAVKAKYIKIGE